MVVESLMLSMKPMIMPKWLQSITLNGRIVRSLNNFELPPSKRLRRDLAHDDAQFVRSSIDFNVRVFIHFLQ